MRADGPWTVLVVEDEARSRASLTRCLEEDYRVLTAQSARDALHVLNSEEVDLLLCDQHMPELNAVDFFRKTRISHPEAIRILITGHTDHRDMIRCIKKQRCTRSCPSLGTPITFCCWYDVPWRAVSSRRHRYLSRELKFADAVLRRQNEGMTKLLRDSYEFDKLVFASDTMGRCM